MPRVLLLLVCLSLLPAARAAAEERVRVVAGVPSWVEPIGIPDVDVDPTRDVRELLSDRQVRLDARGSTTFHHRAFRIERAVGIARVAELPIAFAHDESLEVRVLRRIRSGVATDVLARTRSRIIEPEDERDEGIYDGDRLAILVLEDLRVGDTLEVAYTLVRRLGRAIPVHADASAFGADEDVALARFRLTWPEALALDRRLFEVEEAWVEVDSADELVLSARDLPALEPPADEQGAFDPRPRIQWSEFATFEDVARWAVGIYVRPRTLSPELRSILETLAAEPTLEARVRAAIRFVQEDVRYLGIEIGEAAVVPSTPDDVLRRRYGDCKDKALLLSTLLGELGIDAYPALVDSTRGPFLDELLPSPFDFDHVVVGFVYEGREYFVDPTLTFERGPIAERPSLPYRRALRVRAGETGLVDVPIVEPGQPSTQIEERFETTSGGGATLAVSTVFTGADANAMRERVATESAPSLETEFVDFYGRTYAGIETSAPLVVTDDEDTNVVRVEERYRIPRFFEDGRRELRPWSLADHLEDPESDEPLTLAYPLDVRHVITIVGRAPSGDADERRQLTAEGLDLRRSVRWTGREVRVETELRTHRAEVPDASRDAHFAALRSMRSILAYEARAEVPPTVTTRPRRVPRTSLLALFVSLVAASPLAARLLRARRARRLAVPSPVEPVVAKADASYEKAA